MNVIAEGVENDAQCQQLVELGCEYAQGYYFSEPLTPQAIQNWLSVVST